MGWTRGLHTGPRLDRTSSSSGRLVTVDSYHHRDCFVLDDLEQDSTLPHWASERLWRVVSSRRARCIVTFDVCVDWTRATKGDRHRSGSSELEVLDGEYCKGVVRWNTFKLMNRHCHSALIVRHFVFTGWHANDTVPACRRDEFIRLIRSVPAIIIINGDGNYGQL